jgi:hypothetical protein
MGWFNDEAPRHEGFMQAVRAGTNERGSITFRELDDEDAREGAVGVRIVQVGCDCGWRSQRLRAPHGTTWDGMVLLPRHEAERDSAPAGSKPFESVCRELWRQHAIGAASAGLDGVDD